METEWPLYSDGGRGALKNEWADPMAGPHGLGEMDGLNLLTMNANLSGLFL